MQPGQARTSGLGVPLLLLVGRIGWVAPVRPTLGVWFVVPCPSAALGAYVCAVSGAPWRLFTGVRVPCVLCAMFVATWRLFTGVRVVCGTRVVLVASLPPPPLFFLSCFCFCFFLNETKSGTGCANTTCTCMGSWSRGAAVLCSSSWCALLVSSRRSHPKGAARVSQCTRARVSVGPARYLFASRLSFRRGSWA